MNLDLISYRQITLAPEGGGTAYPWWEPPAEYALEVSQYNFANIQIEVDTLVNSLTYGAALIPVKIKFIMSESNDKVNFSDLEDSEYLFTPTATGIYRASTMINITQFGKYIKPKFFTDSFVGTFNVYSRITLKVK